jgi:S-adenosylmethionine:tRNA ribosyltransferase-isomerase
MKARGVEMRRITLHIGYETFRPVKEDMVEEHVMHSEFYCVEGKTLRAIAGAKKRGRRVIAVGTTTCRVLETIAAGATAGSDRVESQDGISGWTDIFIYPGFQFRTVRAMITNFHLPRSTLLMLVAAFTGRDMILYAYEEAVKAAYRFYSYGDAMLIV